MDLLSGTPYWPTAAGLLAVYPPLARDQRCDVAIVGAGITGALVADALAGAGLTVIVLDRREVAWGSTAASTALLSYELDCELQDLIPKVGEHAAVRAYQLSLQAIGAIGELTRALGDPCGFAERPSLYLASTPAEVPRLEREAELRAEFGLPVEFWDRARIAAHSSLRAAGALRSAIAAEVDPYRLAHALLRRAAERGTRIFDRTEMLACEKRGSGLLLRTNRDATIQAERLVLAPGYEVPEPLQRNLVKLISTYAVVSEPLQSFPGWEDRCLIWETARPYRYIRSTADGRVMIGGEDEDFRDPVLRDRLLDQKSRKLAADLETLLPSLHAEPAFAWTGTFGETADGLPYIGSSEHLPGTVFALGYGGNGITFGVIAAELIRDLCLGRPNDDVELFRLDRESATGLLRT